MTPPLATAMGSPAIAFPPLVNPSVDHVVVAERLDDATMSTLRTIESSVPRREWKRLHRAATDTRTGSVSGWSLDLDLTTDSGQSIVEDVARIVTASNGRVHRFDCDRVSSSDPPVLIRLERGDFVVPTPDLVEGRPTRKLTVLVPLTDAGAYRGGTIGFVPGGSVHLVAGDTLIAPSFAAWGIEAITSGVATFLLVRLHGRPFR